MALAHRPLQLLGEAPFLESTGSLQDIPRAADPSLRGSAPQSTDLGKVEKICVSRFCLSGRLLSWHLLASFFLSLLRLLCLAPSGIICCGMACVARTFRNCTHRRVPQLLLVLCTWRSACRPLFLFLYLRTSRYQTNIVQIGKSSSRHITVDVATTQVEQSSNSASLPNKLQR